MDDLKLTATKIFKFCYAHHLPDYQGHCSELHGHNARVEITTYGTSTTLVGPDYPSMVMDFNLMKEVINPILAKLDHSNLNKTLPKEYRPPTAENIARYLFNTIESEYITLKNVRVYETDDSFVDCTRRD